MCWCRCARNRTRGTHHNTRVHYCYHCGVKVSRAMKRFFIEMDSSNAGAGNGTIDKVELTNGLRRLAAAKVIPKISPIDS